MEAVLFESKFAKTVKYNQTFKSVITILAGSFFIAIASQITLPLQPVPVTLQTFAVLFIGMFFGPKLGSKIIIAYLAEGCLGLPVFANFSFGPAVLFGPTGGYLLGFIPAIFITGYLLQQGWAKTRLTVFLSALLGTIALFVPGYIFLAKFVGWQNAYLFGVAPFYLIEIIKLSILTIITPFFWQPKHNS